MDGQRETKGSDDVRKERGDGLGYCVWHWDAGSAVKRTKTSISCLKKCLEHSPGDAINHRT